MKVGKNKAVGIDYTLYLDDGSIADTTQDSEPLYFLFGYDNIIPGLEKALEGLSVGDKKTVEVEPEDAYGDINPDGFQEIPKTVFPEDAEIELGMPFALMDEDNNYIPATIYEIEENHVLVDLNHPLAGEKLRFEVEVVDIKEASEEELAHGHIHGPDGHHH
ncbi:MAG: peptidylprolyl isomerase [Cyanobacteriota bacterium]